MGKDYRHSRIHKQVHRDLLKEEGKVHLPPNKVQNPKKGGSYKRKKFHKSDLLNLDND